jgi:hypothetical protein
MLSTPFWVCGMHVLRAGFFLCAASLIATSCCICSPAALYSCRMVGFRLLSLPALRGHAVNALCRCQWLGAGARWAETSLLVTLLFTCFLLVGSQTENLDTINKQQVSSSGTSKGSLSGQWQCAICLCRKSLCLATSTLPLAAEALDTPEADLCCTANRYHILYHSCVDRSPMVHACGTWFTQL